MQYYESLNGLRFIINTNRFGTVRPVLKIFMQRSIKYIVRNYWYLVV